MFRVPEQLAPLGRSLEPVVTRTPLPDTLVRPFERESEIERMSGPRFRIVRAGIGSERYAEH